MILITFMLSNQIAQCSCISHLNNKRKENIYLCFYLIVCHFHPRFYCRNQCQQQNLSKVLKHKRCKFAEWQDAQKAIIRFIATIAVFQVILFLDIRNRTYNLLIPPLLIFQLLQKVRKILSIHAVKCIGCHDLPQILRHADRNNFSFLIMLCQKISFFHSILVNQFLLTMAKLLTRLYFLNANYHKTKHVTFVYIIALFIGFHIAIQPIIHFTILLLGLCR